MPSPSDQHPSQPPLIGTRSFIWLLISYGFALAAAPFILDPIRPIIEHDTHTPGAAGEAFFTVCVIAAGVVPLVLTPFLLVYGLLKRQRIRSVSQDVRSHGT